MKTGAREVESLLIFRTIFLYSLMFTFLQLHNSVFLSRNAQSAVFTEYTANIEHFASSLIFKYNIYTQ